MLRMRQWQSLQIFGESLTVVNCDWISMYVSYIPYTLRYVFFFRRNFKDSDDQSLRKNFRQTPLRFISMEAAAKKSHVAWWQEAPSDQQFSARRHVALVEWKPPKKTGKMYGMFSKKQQICINVTRFIGTKHLISNIFHVPPQGSDRWQTQIFFYHQTWLHHIIIFQWCWTSLGTWPFFIHRHLATWWSLLNFQPSRRDLN